MDRMRASDTEREAAAGVLRTAAAEGRLDTDELEERTAAVYSAKTRGELTALIDDIPGDAPLPAPRRRDRRGLPRVPGSAPFTARWRAPVAVDRAKGDLMEFVVPPLHSYGYELVERDADRLVFERTTRPAWTIAVAVLAFPIGLVALLHSGHDRVILSVVDHGDETTVIAHGTAPLRIRRALSELER